MYTVKQWRHLKDISQRKMAELLKVHVQTYRKLENEPGLMTVCVSKKIAHILNVPYDDIFFA